MLTKFFISYGFEAAIWRRKRGGRGGLGRPNNWKKNRERERERKREKVRERGGERGRERERKKEKRREEKIWGGNRSMELFN